MVIGAFAVMVRGNPPAGLVVEGILVAAAVVALLSAVADVVKAIGGWR
jgi:hypothetical protein